MRQVKCRKCQNWFAANQEFCPSCGVDWQQEEEQVRKGSLKERPKPWKVGPPEYLLIQIKDTDPKWLQYIKWSIRIPQLIVIGTASFLFWGVIWLVG